MKYNEQQANKNIQEQVDANDDTSSVLSPSLFSFLSAREWKQEKSQDKEIVTCIFNMRLHRTCKQKYICDEEASGWSS